MPEDQELDLSGSATFNAAGIAVVDLGPKRLKQSWEITKAVVSTTGPTASSPPDDSTAVLLLNGVSQQDGTYTGSLDSTDLALTIRRGFLRARWTGGTAGYTSTLTVYGTVHIG